MKLKITLLTGFVLFAILCVFDVFIFFTLNTQLRSTEMSNTQSRAESLAQAAASNANDQNGSITSITNGSSSWMAQFIRENEVAYLLTPNGHLIAHFGELPVAFDQLQGIKLGESNVSGISIRGTDYYVSAAPVLAGNHSTIIGDAVLVQESGLRSVMRELFTLLIVGSVGAIFLTIAASYFVASISVKPLSRMIKQVEQIEASTLEYRVQERNSIDEAAQLARAFNRMLSRIQRSWDQQSRFVADASHEIRTPLAAIQGYSRLLQRWGKSNPQVLDEALQVIQMESARLHALSDDLLLLTRPEASVNSEDEVTNLRQAVKEAIEVVSPLYPQAHISQDVLDVEVKFPESHLKRVLINLIDNACKYSALDGQPCITASEQRQSVSIHVQDNGIGIPEADLPHVFERFYRVDKSRQRGGTGLGLALVKELVESHHGTVGIDSRPGHGTTVTVTIPINR